MGLDLSSKPSCRICGSSRCSVQLTETRTSRIQEVGGGPIFRCDNCGIVFAATPPKVEYDAEYYRTFPNPGGYDHPPPHLARRLAGVEKHLGTDRHLSILDFGCSRCIFLRLARDRGHRVKGVDISPEATREAAAHALDVWSGDILSAPFEAGSFDFIHGNHVLEHLDRPLQALRRLRELISGSGLLIIEVPNEFRHLSFIVKKSLVPDALRMAVPTLHTFFFTPATLRSTLAKAGFQVFKLTTPSRNSDGEVLSGWRWRIQDRCRLGSNIEAWCRPA